MSMLNEAKRGSLVDDRDRSLKGRIKEIIPWKGDDIKEIIRKLVFIGAVAFLIYWCYTAYIYNFGSKSMIDDQKYLAGLLDKAESDASDDKNDAQKPATPVVNDKNEQSGGDNTDTVVKEPAVMMKKFDELYKLNPDIVGWISIDGIYLGDSDDELAINYPVVQTSDNDYYLEHDFFGEIKDYGALFVDYRAKVGGDEGRSSNVTIYGHNMKTEYYFHHLRDYNTIDPTFISKHRLVNFSSLYSDDQYIIFACFYVSVNEEDDNLPLFSYHNCVEFNDLSQFDYWYKNVMYRNYYRTDIECDINDEYLTLSTCAFEIGDSRFVVVARKLREGEDPDDYTYEYNSKRHMPKKWYNVFDYSMPIDDGPDYEYYIPE